MQRGFIIQPTYRIESNRPVVQIYGVLEGGGSFLIRDTREKPRFWVRSRDVERVRDFGARVVTERPPRHAMDGEPVARIEVHLPADVPSLRDRLQAAGIPSFEADVRFAYRYLIDRGLRGSLEIRGGRRRGAGVDAVFDDPEVGPADWMPRLSVLSFDIETDPRARRLLSISLVGCGASEVLLYTPEGYDCPAGARPFRTERELLAEFVDRVRELDPDVLTGWNVIDFDLAVLQRMAERMGIPLILGRGEEPARVRPATLPRGRSRAVVQGRVVLDGIQLLRGAFVKLDSYALDAAAREILGRGKTIRGRDRARAILDAFKRDRARLVEYNLVDSQLVIEILERLHLLELVVERSRLTGMPPERVGASIASFDYLYLSALAPRRIVAPTVRPDSGWKTELTGGHVLDPSPGLYRNVLVLDFKSLYPAIMRTFNIDPLGRHDAHDGKDDPIVAPNGAAFRRDAGILPAVLDGLFPRRETALAAGDAVAGQAIKILMNSFYGVLGTPACRFAAPELANAITGFGRDILLWSKRWVEERGHRVLYGDTDSLFVLAGSDEPSAALRLGGELVAGLNHDLAAWIERGWQVESRLELKLERLYTRLLLPSVRHGASGARKRYAGLVEGEGEGGSAVVFTGMEVVRRDWTDLAKRVQRELYRRLFSDLPVEDYLCEVIGELRAGELDDLLVYRKALRKKLDGYTSTTPPHVAAARRMKGRHGRIIDYVITEHGAEPAGERSAPIDHEHYVQRQVRPVAEPVLDVLGLEFDRVVGDDAQGRLF